MTTPPRQIKDRADGPRAIALAAVAVALEGYDLSVYGLFALAVGQAFFPARDSTSSLLLAVATLGIGYVVRPIGGLVLGAYSDRSGRRAAVSLTVLLMAISTGAIGLTPSYASIGILAPILVVLARLLQGFSAGGAAAGTIAYLAEAAAPARRGFIASWQQTSQVGAFLLSAGIGAVTASLASRSSVGPWAWRIPFLLAVLFAPLGLYLRRHLSEPEPVAAAEAARVEPLTHAVLANAPAIGVGIGLTCLWNITLFILLFYMPTYVQHQLGVSADAAFSSTAVGAAVLFVLCPFMGALSDRVGRKALMLTAAVLLCVCAYPLLQHLQNHRLLLDLIEVQGALAVLIAGYTAPIAAMLAELFPTQSRSTALSVAYNISTLVVGAFSPLVVTWLIVVTHNPLAPAFYVSGGAAISALTLLLVRDQTGKPLRL